MTIDRRESANLLLAKALQDLCGMKDYPHGVHHHRKTSFIAGRNTRARLRWVRQQRSLAIGGFTMYVEFLQKILTLVAEQRLYISSTDSC
jgi:IS1 family transposase